MPASTNPAAMQMSQFDALQQLLQAGDAAGAEAAALALNKQALAPTQRALVLQLQAEALRRQGERNQALQLGLQSLPLRFSPQLALQCLELLLLPAIQWQQRSTWLSLMRQLVQQQHGPALLRQLRWLLSQYPLDQQRRELIAALDEAELFADIPSLQQQLLRVQAELLGRGGMGAASAAMAFESQERQSLAASTAPFGLLTPLQQGGAS